MATNPFSSKECEAMLRGKFRDSGKIEKWNKLREQYPEWTPDLSHVNLVEANLAEINLEGANLTGAILRGAYLRSANLRSSNLSHADMSVADGWNMNRERPMKVHTCLIDADLSKANLEDADLSDTNFEGAILNNANLRGTINLTKSQLESAKDARNIKYDFDETFNLPGELPRLFVSYSWKDRSAVLAVDQWLRDKGARVIIDDRNFMAGNNVRDEILRWIQQAGVIVCFISKNSADRPYPKLEREIANSLLIKGLTKVIYFKLDDTPLDIHQEERIYVSGHNLSFDEACAQLWKAITELVQPPKTINLEQFRAAGKDWALIKED